MRLDPAIALVMTLFTLMVGATSVSAFWGYSLGRQALSGVTQPDTGRRGRSPNEANPDLESSQEPAALKSEEEILAQVTATIKGESVGEAQPEFQAESVDASADPEKSLADEPESILVPSEGEGNASLVSNQQQFPLLSQHQQVTLAVNSVRQQGTVVRMGVSLQNTGDRPVEFLYSLMDVLDEQGQPLSVSTDGLPQQIPPTGETFQGAVVIPSVLLGSSNTLSLRLTDYPNQQVQLQINDIPVAQ
jgi:hypothetical protein